MEGKRMKIHARRNIAISLSLSLFLFNLVLSAPAQSQKPAWKGKVETENGVKVIKNPADPLYGEFAFDLERDLVLGGDPSKELSYFPNGATMSVDREGNLYVADMGNRRVQMFDKTGAFVRQIGRQGQGPGEYAFPSRVLFDKEGNPCVSGGRELIFYDKNGAYQKKVMPKTFLSIFVLGPRDTIIGTTQPGLGPGGPKNTIVQLNADGTPLRTIAEFRGEFSESQKAITFHAYSNRLAFSPLTTDLFCYGFSEEYRIFVADAEGRTVYIIAKDEKPQSISGKEKDQTRKSGIYMWTGPGEKEDAVVFPDHRPFFGNIMNDDAGRLYVVRSGSILNKDAPRQIDIFSKDGIFLYRMTWNFIPSAIKNGFLYGVHTDKETGEITIVRSKVKNWDAMKTG
jgi:hypothetical protein